MLNNALIFANKSYTFIYYLVYWVTLPFIDTVRTIGAGLLGLKPVSKSLATKIAVSIVSFSSAIHPLSVVYDTFSSSKPIFLPIYLSILLT